MDILSVLLRGTRWERFGRLSPIVTSRLVIAPLRPEDTDEVRRLTDDPAITGAVDFLPERFGTADAERLVRAACSGRDVFLGFRAREGDALVGVMGAHLRALEAVEIGYWIGGATRGRGFGAEAVGAVVRALAGLYPRRAIVAECRPENVASWQLLNKLGFGPTGDAGRREGRKLLVWEEKRAPRTQSTAPRIALSRGRTSGEEAL